MPAIPPAAFADHLRALSHETFVSFIADLWAASGWETTVDGTVVIAREDGLIRQILVRKPSRFRRLQSPPDPGREIDLVVFPHPDPTDRVEDAVPDAEVVTADDLRDRLLYSVPTDEGEQIARERLGVPLRGEQWEPTDPALVRIGRAVPGTDGVVSRRAALGLLGVAVGGVVAWRLSAAGEDGDRPEDPGFDGESVDTPEPNTPDSASFAFEFDGGELRIVHDGGDPVSAGRLRLRSEGLSISPAVDWSDVAEVAPDTAVEEGDAISLSVPDAFELTILLERESGDVVVGEFARGDLDNGEEGPTFRRPPIASFVFEYNPETEQLEIAHEEGDPVRADELAVRGTGFLWSPATRWSEQPAIEGGEAITPGTAATFVNVEPDAVVRIFWDDGSDTPPVVLGRFLGPERPLDTSLDGVSSDRYGPLNTGFARGVAEAPSEVEERWRFDRPRTFGSSLAIGDGILVVAGQDGTVFGLDAVDGTELWRTRLGGWLGATPVVGAETVIVRQFGGSRNQLRALALDDGSVRWSVELPHQQLGRPTVSDGSVIVPAAGGTNFNGVVYAVDIEGGRSKWGRTVDNFVVPTTVAVADGTVYVTPSTGVLAYEVDGGVPQWDVTSEEPADKFWWPMIAGETLLVFQLGGDTDRLTAMDRADGSRQFQTPVAREVGALPAVGNGTVYVGYADGGVQALDRRDGADQWQSETDAPVQTMTVSWDALYAADGEGAVHGFSAVDGESLLSFDTDMDTVRTLVVHQDRLFVCGESVVGYQLD